MRNRSEMILSLMPSEWISWKHEYELCINNAINSNYAQNCISLKHGSDITNVLTYIVLFWRPVRHARPKFYT